MNKDLVQKYNVAGPRYTSYPTVPHWNNTPSTEDWNKQVYQTFKATNSTEGISLYLHLPFCESLCTYCGCNTRITVNHQVELPYIESLLQEWSHYLSLFDETPIIRELHLGGGTPTFFSAENLTYLLESIFSKAKIHENHQFSFEGHPNNTTKEHLLALYKLGFRRLSFGIQDFDPAVQDIINRVQSFETVEAIYNEARAIGYTSINFDLVYGLPLQNIDSIKQTVELCNKLRPDRYAFYSYAHVPWLKAGQRRYTEADLPSGAEKRALYDFGKELLEEAGYLEIGMDHFALPSDELSIAVEQNNMHRNFMGYTTAQTELLIGLGASSISDSGHCFIQNVKVVEAYREAINEKGNAFFKGHILSEDEYAMRQEILDIMCHFRGDISRVGIGNEEGLNLFSEFIEDGLMTLEGSKIEVLEKGRPFVRNICMAIDPFLKGENVSDKPVFSQTV